MEQVEVIESGPVKYTGSKTKHSQYRSLVSSERVECSECGEDFWRWEDQEGDVCGSCQWNGKAESSR